MPGVNLGESLRILPARYLDPPILFPVGCDVFRLGLN